MKRLKKCVFRLMAAVCMVLVCCVGCSSGKDVNSSSLSLTDGILSWDSNEKAAYYEVKMGLNSVTCMETQFELSELCKYEGENTVTVSMVSDSGDKKELGSMELIMKELEQPAISIMEKEDGETVFSWKAQEEAGGYGYDLNDGYGVREAEIGEDQMVRIVVPNNDQRMFAVIMNGTSIGNTYYIGSKVLYRYQGKMLFDFSKMGDHPFYAISNGQNGETLTAAVDLPKGVYTLDMTYAVMDLNGRSLSGNGTWGRRILIEGTPGITWFCEEEVDNGHGTRGGKDTLPTADETVTYTQEISVNKYGEINITMNNFLANEMFVIIDIQLDGKSVMADGLKTHSAEDDAQFDIMKLEDYLAVFEGRGTYSSTAPQNDVFTIPVNLPNGYYEMEINYQLMTAEGKKISGNGVWGRRISNENMEEMKWYCDYALKPHTEGMDLPLSTQTLTSTFRVKVKDGSFNILCMNFNYGEIMAVSSVKAISGSTGCFDLSTLKNYKNVYVEKTQGSVTEWDIQTTLAQRGIFDLEITYYVVGSDGYKCSGNGTWGRRVIPVGSEKIMWLCVEEVDNGGGTKGGKDTLPEPNKAVTATIQAALNNKGVLTLGMYNFLEGEMFIIEDITYNGESILK